MHLILSNVHFRYRKGPDVLAGVSWSPPPACLTAVIGPNGAGKSTLLRLAAGILKPRAGAVTLGSEPAASIPPHRRSAALAYIAQRSEMVEPFTVRQVVRMGRVRAPRDDAAVADAIDRLELAHLAHRPFGSLSEGQRQRVSLARVLAQLHARATPPEHQTILADEPCAAMDPRSQLQAMSLLRRHACARRVVVVLHDLTTAVRFADRALLLDSSGRVAADGHAADVLRPEILEPVFGVGFARIAAPDRPGEPLAIVPTLHAPP